MIYALREDSNVGGEVYERELLARLPGCGIALGVGFFTGGVHWTRAPLVIGPWVARRAGSAALLRGHSVRHTGPALLLGRALAGARVPVFRHHHHLDPRWAGLEARIAARADAVITVSEFSRQALESAGVPPASVHVIPEGISRPPRTDGWPGAWPREGLRALYLGRLEPRKRPDLALAAARRAGHPIVIAGEGPLRGELEAAHPEARFLGRVSEEQKWRLLDSADVLLFGSSLEGFGLVVAEAQSRGVPVIATAGTATAEALEDGASGFLAPPDPAAFSAALERLVDPELRARFSARAREHAARFDWERCAAAVAELYRSIASSSAGSVTGAAQTKRSHT